ncbi:hypothetical protein VTJ04DRAFT_8676 [Mycothermus thermophilus]|uniref:uncharacterized protein n=1 Tax=Humicola insolens TaxID=85995 RepID=UPI0037430A20
MGSKSQAAGEAANCPQNKSKHELPGGFTSPVGPNTTPTCDNITTDLSNPVTTTSQEPIISASISDKRRENIEMDFIRNSVSEAGVHQLALGVSIFVAGLALASILIFFFLSWSWIITIGGVLVSVLIWRHFTIKHSRPRRDLARQWITTQPSSTRPETSQLPAVYFMYVLGSGGHTSEMLETIKRKFTPQANLHRRYLITVGDHDSLRRLCQLEDLFVRSLPDSRYRGTWDVVWVPRARRVHQPLWTAPFTCLQTALWTITALLKTPDPRRHPDDSGDDFKYPHIIVTNGPGTGFIVCLVAYLLKLLALAPATRLRTVYVESWARSRTLSLTGRLFLFSGLADMFCVQHPQLERRFGRWGAIFVGNVGRPRPPLPRQG